MYVSVITQRCHLYIVPVIVTLQVIPAQTFWQNLSVAHKDQSQPMSPGGEMVLR